MTVYIPCFFSNAETSTRLCLLAKYAAINPLFLNQQTRKLNTYPAIRLVQCGDSKQWQLVDLNTAEGVVAMPFADEYTAECQASVEAYARLHQEKLNLINLANAVNQHEIERTLQEKSNAQEELIEKLKALIVDTNTAVHTQFTFRLMDILELAKDAYQNEIKELFEIVKNLVQHDTEDFIVRLNKLAGLVGAEKIPQPTVSAGSMLFKAAVSSQPATSMLVYSKTL